MDALMGTAPTAVEIEALRAEIERMRSALNAERLKAVEAMETLSKSLHAKANEHDLCEAYDEVIDEVNSALPVGFPRLDARKRTWKVKGTYIVTIEREIDATREADALDDFRDEVERELDSLRDSGEIDDYDHDESTATIASES